MKTGDKDLEMFFRRSAAALRQSADTLPDRKVSGKPDEMVHAARLRISKGRKAPDPLVRAANAAGFTLRSLAEEVGCSHALLYQARKGDTAIRRSWAERIETLTGFAASKAHWPRGWASE
jgi:hypothetical protein